MVRRLVIGIVVALVVGGIAMGSILSVLHKHAVRNDSVKNQKKEDIAVTVVEGKRREEIAAQMAALGITGYDEFLTASTKYEGELFPDTYRFFPNTPADEVVAKMRATFALKVGSVTPHQLILASIIEREAKDATDRPIIAGVYENRLARGMDLEADPTVQYGKDSIGYAATKTPRTFSFWSQITRDDYSSVNSTYNTYKNDGLPPTPICNPGKSSIDAAITPASHDYLFFVHRNGKLLLAKTLAEHEINLTK